MTHLSVRPTEVEPSEAVIITVWVANTGGTEGRYSVVLKINGVKEAEKSVTIAAGGIQPVSFTISKEDDRAYIITMDGLIGSFTVMAPPPAPIAPPPEVIPPPPPNWPLIGGIIAGVIIVGLFIFFLISRRELTKYLSKLDQKMSIKEFIADALKLVYDLRRVWKRKQG